MSGERGIVISIAITALALGMMIALVLPVLSTNPKLGPPA